MLILSCLHSRSPKFHQNFTADISFSGICLIQVEELELSKAKATSLLKSFEGDVQKALRSQIYAN